MKLPGARLLCGLLPLAGLLSGCSARSPLSQGEGGGQLAACPASPNCVSSLSRDESHAIAPLIYSGDPDRAFTILKTVLAQRRDARIMENRNDYCRVELHTRLFVDDGEFLLDRIASVIHVRSASRLGYSDLGKNRSRMEEIRAAFTAALKQSRSDRP